MRILLVEPHKPGLSIGGEDVFMFEPLALEYIAAGVPEGNDVKILDLRIDRDFHGTLERFNPHIVGITAYTVHVNVVRQLCAQVKAFDDQILTVVGGHHATVKPEDFDSPSIDLTVIGEGVFAFREIVERSDRGEELANIHGVYSPNQPNAITFEKVSNIELDSLPFPNRKLTAKYREHYYSEWMKPLASIRTSKGCPYRCKFCAQWKVAGGRYLKRDPHKVVAELAGIEEEFIFFADDESLIDAPRMMTLARLIQEAGIQKRYFLYGRSDTITDNPDLLKFWREIGLERVFIGLESFQDEDLESIRKKSTIAQNNAAVRILHELGIDIYASFIIQPGFTHADFAALRRYCRKLELNFASFAVLTPLPGTDLYAEVEDRLIIRNYDCFDFIHTLLPTTLPIKDFYREYWKIQKYGLSLIKQLSFLRKYPPRELPRLWVKSNQFYDRLKLTYRDYEL